MRIGRVTLSELSPEAQSLLVVLEDHGDWALALSSHFRRVPTGGEIPWYRERGDGFAVVS